MFKDITPLLLDAAALRYAVAQLAEVTRELDADYVVAADARGFVLGGAIAERSGAGFIPARKPGKLPWPEKHSVEYVLEYGVDALEVHRDALSEGARVLVHDDLLATGGTARAMCDLVEKAGGHVVGCAFLVELGFLGGRAKLAPPYEVRSLVVFEDE